MNNLYKDTISKFPGDIRFWVAYMKFCKHVVSKKINRFFLFCYIYILYILNISIA